MEERPKLVELVEMDKNKDRITISGAIILEVLCYLIGIVSIVFAWIWYNSDLDISSSGNPFRFHEERYVGGDAYNYIISAGRSSAVMIKSLIWMTFGCASIIIGVLFSIKKKLCK